LDIPAALGSKKARSILLDTYKEAVAWPTYEKLLNQVTADYAKISDRKWQSNLYYYWLYCLKSLIERDANTKYPFFMNNSAWDVKTLNTFTSSWTELRHNTVLYALQSGAEGGGDDEEKPNIDYPRSFVEPNTTFYKRMANIIETTKISLKEHSQLSTDSKESLDEFYNIVMFLDTINNKELEGLPVSRREHEDMQKIGGRIGYLMSTSGREVPTESETVNDTDQPEYMQKDNHMGVVVDVHNSQGTCLEVGVGSGNLIYVAVEIEGKLRLLRGAVFSYYEFTRPASERLNDFAWHQMIYDNKIPAQPEWLSEMMSDGSVLVEQRSTQEYIRADPSVRPKRTKKGK
jgi:hypothetical protein